MSASPSIWHTLGITPTADSLAIRRAYAAALKVTHPEDDPEAFKILRAAYETALRLAAHQARADAANTMAPATPAPPATAATEPVATNESTAAPDTGPATQAQPPRPPDASMLELQRAFQTLHQALTSQQGELPAAAAIALSAILQSSALENVSLEQQVQHRLAELLASTVPRSDPLLDEPVRRFGWHNSSTQLHLTPAMAFILARLHDLAFLAELHSRESPYSRAFDGLRRPKTRVWSWLSAHIHRSGRPGEYQLLHLIRVQHPTLLRLLNADAVAWWDRLASRPQLSFPLVAVGVALGTLLGLIAWANDWSMTVALTAAVLFGGFALGKLFLLDWPRHVFREKWPVGGPLWMRLGWLPLGIVCLLLAAVLPPWRTSAWIFGICSLLAVLWVLIIRQVSEAQHRAETIVGPMAALLVPQIIMGLWWVAAVEHFPDNAAVPMALPFFSLMLTTSIGLSPSQSYWIHELTSAQRRYVLIGISVFAAVTAVLIWHATVRTEWRPLCVALIGVAVALHRPIAMLMSWRQQEVRFGLLIAGAIALAFVADHPVFQARTPVLGGLGVLIVATVLLCMLMALFNERRGRPVPHAHE